MKLEDLNEKQRKAVLHNDGSLAVLSSAGSGKTRTIVTKMVYLVNELGVNPRRILACTFTKKAANEMKNRLKPILGPEQTEHLKLGTLHSMAYQIYKQGMSVTDKHFRMPILLTNPFGILNHLYAFTKDGNFINKDAKAYMQVIANAKLDLIKPNQFLSFYKPGIGGTSPSNDFNVAAYEVYKEYEKWMKKNNKIDFQDMLVNCYYMLIDPRCAEYVSNLQDRCEYILVDEAQDTNTVSFKIIDILAEKWRRVTIVGDTRQCQPAGTQITLTGGKTVKIEDLKIGSQVVSFRRDNAYFGGINTQGRKVTEKKKRSFKGNVFTIGCDGKETKATYNHKFLAKYNVNRKTYGGYVVYMMRRGGSFRIGWCKLFEKSATNHFFFRCRMEDADGWILRLCEDKQEASFYESLYSTQFGLPLPMFNEAPHAKAHFTKMYTQEFLDKLYSEYPSLLPRAIKCLKHFGRDIDHPYYKTKDYKIKGRNTVFEINACNLLPEIMSIPSFTGNKDSNYQPINVTYKYEECDVYSLNVELNHTYIADGLLTCNCIYSFQGARKENIDNFISKYKPKIIDLNTNYRSTKAIVDNANKLIGYGKDIIGEEANTPNEEGEEIKYFTNPCVMEEADTILSCIDDLRSKGNNYSDITILYRVHSQAREIEDRFLMEDIPYVSYNESNFFDRKEIKDVLTYLRIASNPSLLEIEDLKRIANKPTRYVSTYSLNKLDDIAFDSGETLWEILGTVHSQNLDYKLKSSLDSLYTSLQRLVSFNLKGASPSELVKYVLDDMGYEQWALEEKRVKMPDVDVSLNFDALLDSITKFETVKEFVAFIKEVEEKNKEKQSSNGDFVKLMSIHASKGKEFKNVIVLGVCDRLYPLYKAREEGNTEEERRVMYVAITRPEKELYISVINGRLGRIKVNPSEYLYEMNINYNGGRNVRY